MVGLKPWSGLNAPTSLMVVAWVGVGLCVAAGLVASQPSTLCPGGNSGVESQKSDLVFSQSQVLIMGVPEAVSINYSNPSVLAVWRDGADYRALTRNYLAQASHIQTSGNKNGYIFIATQSDASTTAFIRLDTINALVDVQFTTRTGMNAGFALNPDDPQVWFILQPHGGGLLSHSFASGHDSVIATVAADAHSLAYYQPTKTHFFIQSGAIFDVKPLAGAVQFFPLTSTASARNAHLCVDTTHAAIVVTDTVPSGAFTVMRILVKVQPILTVLYTSTSYQFGSITRDDTGGVFYIACADNSVIPAARSICVLTDSGVLNPNRFSRHDVVSVHFFAGSYGPPTSQLLVLTRSQPTNDRSYPTSLLRVDVTTGSASATNNATFPYVTLYHNHPHSSARVSQNSFLYHALSYGTMCNASSILPCSQQAEIFAQTLVIPFSTNVTVTPNHDSQPRSWWVRPGELIGSMDVDNVTGVVYWTETNPTLQRTRLMGAPATASAYGGWGDAPAPVEYLSTLTGGGGMTHGISAVDPQTENPDLVYWSGRNVIYRSATLTPPMRVLVSAPANISTIAVDIPGDDLFVALSDGRVLHCLVAVSNRCLTLFRTAAEAVVTAMALNPGPSLMYFVETNHQTGTSQFKGLSYFDSNTPVLIPNTAVSAATQLLCSPDGVVYCYEPLASRVSLYQYEMDPTSHQILSRAPIPIAPFVGDMRGIAFDTTLDVVYYASAHRIGRFDFSPHSGGPFDPRLEEFEPLWEQYPINLDDTTNRNLPGTSVGRLVPQFSSDTLFWLSTGYCAAQINNDLCQSLYSASLTNVPAPTLVWTRTIPASSVDGSAAYFNTTALLSVDSEIEHVAYFLLPYCGSPDGAMTVNASDCIVVLDSGDGAYKRTIVLDMQGGLVSGAVVDAAAGLLYVSSGHLILVMNTDGSNQQIWYSFAVGTTFVGCPQLIANHLYVMQTGPTQSVLTSIAVPGANETVTHTVARGGVIGFFVDLDPGTTTPIPAVYFHDSSLIWYAPLRAAVASTAINIQKNTAIDRLNVVINSTAPAVPDAPFGQLYWSSTEAAVRCFFAAPALKAAPATTVSLARSQRCLGNAHPVPSPTAYGGPIYPENTSAGWRISHLLVHAHFDRFWFGGAEAWLVIGALGTQGLALLGPLPVPPLIAGLSPPASQALSPIKVQYEAGVMGAPLPVIRWLSYARIATFDPASKAVDGFSLLVHSSQPPPTDPSQGVGISAFADESQSANFYTVSHQIYVLALNNTRNSVGAQVLNGTAGTDWFVSIDSGDTPTPVDGGYSYLVNIMHSPTTGGVSGYYPQRVIMNYDPQDYDHFTTITPGPLPFDVDTVTTTISVQFASQCWDTKSGCTHFCACNYDSEATSDDGSCDDSCCIESVDEWVGSYASAPGLHDQYQCPTTDCCCVTAFYIDALNQTLLEFTANTDGRLCNNSHFVEAVQFNLPFTIDHSFGTQFLGSEWSIRKIASNRLSFTDLRNANRGCRGELLLIPEPAGDSSLNETTLVVYALSLVGVFILIAVVVYCRKKMTPESEIERSAGMGNPITDTSRPPGSVVPNARRTPGGYGGLTEADTMANRMGVSASKSSGAVTAPQSIRISVRRDTPTRGGGAAGLGTATRGGSPGARGRGRGGSPRGRGRGGPITGRTQSPQPQPLQSARNPNVAAPATQPVVAHAAPATTDFSTSPNTSITAPLVAANDPLLTSNVHSDSSNAV